MNNVSSISPQGDNAAAASGGAGFGPLVTTGANIPEGFNFVEAQAQEEIAEIASDPGNSALKMQLAQQGISLTDNSDVGAGERFGSFAEKLGHVRDLKAKLLVAMIMSMVSSGGSGPSGSDEITEARKALRGG